MSGKLIVSQRSWHYRYLAWVDRFLGASYYETFNAPKTLCGYFWCVLLSPLVLALFVFGKWVVAPAVKLIGRPITKIGRRLGKRVDIRIDGTVVAVLACSAFASGLTAAFFCDWLVTLEVIGEVVGILAGGIAAVAALAVIEHRRNKRERKEHASTLSLIGQTIKAKKRHACPLIEVRP